LVSSRTRTKEIISSQATDAFTTTFLEEEAFSITVSVLSEVLGNLEAILSFNSDFDS